MPFWGLLGLARVRQGSDFEVNPYRFVMVSFVALVDFGRSRWGAWERNEAVGIMMQIVLGARGCPTTGYVEPGPAPKVFLDPDLFFCFVSYLI